MESEMKSDARSEVQTALDLCEPLFLELCKVRRAASLAIEAAIESEQQSSTPGGKIQSGPPRPAITRDTLDSWRSALVAALQTVEQTPTDSMLSRTRQELLFPLYVTVDYIMLRLVERANRCSATSLEWADVTKKAFSTEAHFDEYIDRLERALSARESEENRAILAVYYVCIGMGCFARLNSDPEKMKSLMRQLKQERLRNFIDADRDGKLCQEAYDVPVADKPLVGEGNERVIIAAAIGGALLFVLAIFVGVTYWYSQMVPATTTGNLTPAVSSQSGEKRQ